MKKNLLLVGIIVLSAFGLLAISFTSTDAPDPAPKKKEVEVADCRGKVEAPRNFHYDVGSRFSNTITKEELLNATSIHDIISEDAMYSIESMWDVEFFWHKPGKDWIAKGDDHELTQGQLDLLQLMEYSSDYNIAGLCKRKHKESGVIVEGYFDHYFTVVPETQANFEGGKDALTNYLISNSKALTQFLDPEKLQPGKISFTVTSEGNVSAVTLRNSCGFENVDANLMKIVKEMPQKWTPAENSKGEQVDQEFVFSFGHMGC